MEDLTKFKAIKISEKINSGELSREEVYSFFKERADKYDSSLGSFVEIYDQAFTSQENSIFSGLPIAIKDNICIKNKKITCASKILSNHKAVFDAEVVSKLKKFGLSIIGTTNMDEFAFGSSTENSCYGPTKNPWDLTRVVGGSSGGSAAAVAARLVPFALGSDTGGSIRQPACFCGVVGFKPTYGRVSRWGLVAFGSSLDQIGPITTNFTDCAHLLSIICGYDNKDSTSASIEVPNFSEALDKDITGMRIGIPKEYFKQGLALEVREAVDKVKKFFQDKGAKIIEVSLPHTEYAVAVYYIIASSEASSNLQRFDGVRYGLRAKNNNLEELYTESRGEGFGDEAKRRIFLGVHSLSSGYYDAYYSKALKVRRLIKRDFDQVFKDVDVLLTPTSPTTAFKIGEKISDPISMYLSDIYTISVNLAGLPAVSFPCGFSSDNLPIGVQLIGKEFDESSLIKLGSSFEAETDFYKKIPKMNYE